MLELYKDIRQDWIRRLKETKTPQCTLSLKQGECRCAIGILADILVEKWPHLFSWGRYKRSEAIVLSFDHEANGNTFCHASNLLFWRLNILGELAHYVWRLNDTAELPFPEIAKWLEQNTTDSTQTLDDRLKDFQNELLCA